PEQPADFAWSNAKPLDHLIVNVYGSGNGKFDLYEDDGISLDYDKSHALTPMRYTREPGGAHRIVIGPTRGAFAGQVQRRSYTLQIHGINRPVSIAVDGQNVGDWNWDAANATAAVPIPAHAIRDRITIEWRAKTK
ncbi:MAG TPA: DUF5110 domain-containing protein, partial [Rhodanobacteraceae bacterium]